MTTADHIGVFDSGVGGLTVLRELVRALPGKRFVYLGDTARVPYGTKSAETVVKYALGAARVLADRAQLGALVVACNTASAVALDALRSALAVPVFGVIEPGAAAGVAATRVGRVAVLATPATIASRAYEHAIHALDRRVRVFGIACPLFVPLAEAGWVDDDVARLVAERYLHPIVNGTARDVDTVILGCTHYPLLDRVIRRTVGRGRRVVDSASATAADVALALGAVTASRARARAHIEVLVTDRAMGVAETARRFFGDSVGRIARVDL
ncbi:MAG: glutamate racemase [Deltaproteobacteria bacterium]|nr:glutamate racemase [Deltaproteobacteria bacterium]